MAVFVPRFLRQMRDVLIGTPADNDVLTYDTADSKWKPAAGGGGGGLTFAQILAAMLAEGWTFDAATGQVVLAPTDNTLPALSKIVAPAGFRDNSPDSSFVDFVDQNGDTVYRIDAWGDIWFYGADGGGPSGLFLKSLDFPLAETRIYSGSVAGQWRLYATDTAGAQLYGLQNAGQWYLGESADPGNIAAAGGWVFVDGGLLWFRSGPNNTVGLVSMAGHAHAGEDVTSGTVADARIAATIARDSEVAAGDAAVQANLDAHTGDTADAHDASAISVLDTAGDFTATDVEGALAELQTADEADEAALAAHLADTGDAHDASAISSVAAGGLSATDVQAALNELDTEKQPLDADLTAIAALADPNADRLLFWDDSLGAYTYLTPGTNLTITATTIDAAGGSSVSYPRKYKTGLYYQTNQEPPADSTCTPVKDRVEYHPFPVGEALTIDRITVGVQTVGTATSVVRLGIYADTDGMPDARVLDAGTVAGDSTGYKEITVSQALSAGTLYWIAVVWQVAAVGVLRASGVGSGAAWVGHASNLVDPRASTYLQASVTGALPANATPTAVGVSNTSQIAVKVRAV